MRKFFKTGLLIIYIVVDLPTTFVTIDVAVTINFAKLYKISPRTFISHSLVVYWFVSVQDKLQFENIDKYIYSDTIYRLKIC